MEDTSPHPRSRRIVLAGALAAGASASVATAAPASAATTYRPAHYRGAPLLSRSARHLVSRFSYGVTPGLAADVRRAGGARKWFEQQLSPSSVSDPAVSGLRSWWGQGLSLSAEALWHRQRDGIEGGWVVMANYQRWALLRRIKSRRQVQEVMAEFWENHFNVPVNGDAAFTWRTDFGVQLRAKALTSFSELLKTATLHPSMGIYLDNAVSTKSAPNENLGRELLELHTVGRAAGYTEDDVKNSARILTGYRVNMWTDFAASYRKEDHWIGPVTVLGFHHDNGAQDGRPVTEAFLDYLARHESTARRIARKLCVKFVSDDPPESLVGRLASVYLQHDTQIKPVLRALVGSAEFAASVGKKVRDPGEDLVATYRLLRTKVSQPPAPSPDNAHTLGEYAAHAIVWQCGSMGSAPFSWPRPDGQPVDNESWSSPARLISSMSTHYGMSGGWWPRRGITYRSRKKWAPELPIRFDKLVDHLSQQILHQRSTAALLEACCIAADTRPGEKITAQHPVLDWASPRLLTVFFDCPAFYLR
jgi:hypothetical protein